MSGERIVRVKDGTPVLTIDGFFGESSDDCIPVILSSRDRHIIYNLVFPSVYWPTRFGNWVIPGLLKTASDEQFLELCNTARELAGKLLGVEMTTCFSEMADAIKYLADKMSSQACCGSGLPGEPGGPGTGGTGNTPAPQDGGVGMPGQGDPPEGYSSWGDFLSDKCAKAHWLADTIASDLSTMSTLQLLGATAVWAAGTIGLLFLTPVPGAGLIALATIAIALATYGGATLSELSSVFGDNKEDIACALYEGSDTSSSQAAAELVFSDAIDADTSDPIIRLYSKQIVGYILSNDAVNKLYKKDVSRTYPAANCDGCGEPWFALPANVSLVSGSLDQYTSGFTLESTSSGFFCAIDVIADFCVRLKVAEITGAFTPAQIVNGYVTGAFDCSGDFYGTNGTPLGVTFCQGNNAVEGHNRLTLGSSTGPFQVRFEVFTDVSSC